LHRTSHNALNLKLVHNARRGAPYNRADGPSRMVKRPTGSGGEPSSPNCRVSAGVKARHLFKKSVGTCCADAFCFLGFDPFALPRDKSRFHSTSRIRGLHGGLVLLELGFELGYALGGGVGFVVDHPPCLCGSVFDEAV
jgi:hypothetical protein